MSLLEAAAKALAFVTALVLSGGAIYTATGVGASGHPYGAAIYFMTLGVLLWAGVTYALYSSS